MTKVFSFANHKGGVGKSSSCSAIGAYLHKLKYKVLLVDLDPQANLTLMFGVKPTQTIYDALRGKVALSNIIASISDGLDIVPSNLDLCGAEIELSSESGREFILKDLLSPVKNNYDYILIDCPPSLGLLTLNSLTASDRVLIPLQAQFLAMHGFSKLQDVIYKIQKRLNPNLRISGVFLTQYDSRKILNRNVAETLQKHFKGKVFKVKIRNNIAIAEASAVGKHLFDYNKKCSGAVDYEALTKEILAREKHV